MLPDPIGFGLVLLGANLLGDLHRLLSQIRLLTATLAALSILDFYQPPDTAGSDLLASLWLMAGLAVAVALALLAWWMCQVVADFARRVGVPSTLRAAELKRLVFVGWQVAVALTLVLALLLVGADELAIFVMALFFAGVAVLGLLMELMLQAAQLCGGKEPEFVAAPAPTAETVPAQA